ncbi:catabolic 3-dehydroquinase [Lineolata rhizophorae]|uniref:Catabolic 3-dehydroquinase n=1 Tax=Lineolata rhizophorae TaxID=578093 RepID=A0A6A6P801_9PEZI|nr:catabolic 3-dehydroquinase [Lineolata rhizophorae]
MVLLLNGPNLNLLGTREPNLYGSTTLVQVVSSLKSTAKSLGAVVEAYQSNWEGALIDTIHDARGKFDAIIINPGAFTHTSVAIRDALIGVQIPFIEVHITNVHKREEFRCRSFLSDQAEAVICGLGTYGYEVALRSALSLPTLKSRAKI